MSEITKIRVEINIPGQGEEAHEFEYCPIWETNSTCKLGKLPCKYGLTMIDVPQACPLRIGTVEMKFSRLRDHYSGKQK